MTEADSYVRMHKDDGRGPGRDGDRIFNHAPFEIVWIFESLE